VEEIDEVLDEIVVKYTVQFEKTPVINYYMKCPLQNLQAVDTEGQTYGSF
jgi:hypothetical protein